MSVIYNIFSKTFSIFSRDRCRTSINVLGDSYGAGIIAKLSQNDLEALDNPEQNGKAACVNEIMITDSEDEADTNL